MSSNFVTHTQNNSVGGQLHRAIAEQFELEIALRKRLLTAANARLEWARILRDSIAEKDHKTPVAGYPAAAFKDAALATYQAIEDRCRFIISSPCRHHIDGRTAPRLDFRATEAPRTRKRVGLGHAPSTGPLFFEDNSTTTPVTLKLVCPDCSRSDFPTMQGFLNHCRLAHQQNYGTHDECIQACGVIIENDERETLLAAGIEIKTINLLSLKRIFERAVGLGQHVNTGPEDAQATQPVDEPFQPSTHLSQTLGLHKDTPSLAPFLGKEVKKKTIHVYDEGDIDVVESDHDTRSRSRPSWIFKHRTRRRPGDKIFTNVPPGKKIVIKGPEHPSVPINSTDDQGTRFHITRRILVSDRSLYFVPTRRLSDTHTHRWQISVSSPSYEQHISTFLMRLTVTCVTQPPVFTSPIIVAEPPFIACSTTDRPFLARLSLKWVGEQNNEFVVEHWVELDQSKAARPALGEEQMLDVELDRNTIFRPVSVSVGTISWTGEGDHGSRPISDDTGVNSTAIHEGESSLGSDPPHVQLLESIVLQFPITLQDPRSRHSPRVPYVVHTSPAKFLGLTLGRRKAIEWSRALAIRSKYDALVTSPPLSSHDYVRLTTADIYRWLESEGLFPRQRPRVQKTSGVGVINTSPSESSQPPAPIQKVKAEPLFCSVCGVDIHFHSPGIPFNLQQSEGQPNGFYCPAELERRSPPLVHVSVLVAPPRIPYWELHIDHTWYDITHVNARDIVSLVHPHMTRFARAEASRLNLSRFNIVEESWELCFGRSREDIEKILAPYAILGAVLEKVVKDLVGCALQVVQESRYRTMTPYGRTLGTNVTLLLTRTHVLQGFFKLSEMGGSKEALFKCFARLGTLLEVVHDGGGVANSPAGPARQ